MEKKYDSAKYHLIHVLCAIIPVLPFTAWLVWTHTENIQQIMLLPFFIAATHFIIEAFSIVGSSMIVMDRVLPEPQKERLCEMIWALEHFCIYFVSAYMFILIMY